MNKHRGNDDAGPKDNIFAQLINGFKDHVHQNSDTNNGTPQLWGKPKFKNLQLEDTKETIQKAIDFLKDFVEVQSGVKLKSGHELNINIKLNNDDIIITFNEPTPLAEVHYIINLSSKILNIRANVNEVEIELNGFPNPKFEVIS